MEKRCEAGGRGNMNHTPQSVVQRGKRGVRVGVGGCFKYLTSVVQCTKEVHMMVGVGGEMIHKVWKDGTVEQQRSEGGVWRCTAYCISECGTMQKRGVMVGVRRCLTYLRM